MTSGIITPSQIFFAADFADTPDMEKPPSFRHSDL